jgi:hypothetical protein
MIIPVAVVDVDMVPQTSFRRTLPHQLQQVKVEEEVVEVNAGTGVVVLVVLVALLLPTPRRFDPPFENRRRHVESKQLQGLIVYPRLQPSSQKRDIALRTGLRPRSPKPPTASSARDLIANRLPRYQQQQQQQKEARVHLNR